MIRFTVPGEPRGKGSVRSRVVQPKDKAAFVHTYPDSKTKAEMVAIRTIAAAAMRGRPPLTGRIELWLCAYRHLPKSLSKKDREAAANGALAPISRPDYDNYGKMLDALSGVVWSDDAQVTDAHLFKRYSDRPRLVVEVIEVPPGQVTMEVPE